MKVVMINGSPHKNGSTAEALREVGHGLTDGGASRRNDDCADRAEPICTGGGTAIIPSCYWCMVHGSTPEEVRADAEGMRIAYTLGKRMAEYTQRLC